MPKRTERLAYVRNIALDYLLRCPWSNYDQLVGVDLDDVLSQPVEPRAFTLASEWLAADPGRAAVFANATPRYYDIWALRHDRWCPADSWHSIWYRGDGKDFESVKFKEVIARQVRIPINAPPIEVRSAFGGLAICRLPAALDARYRGIDSSGRETSEHVAFNEQMVRAGGRLFIYPPLCMHAPLEHLYNPSEFRLRWRFAFQWERIADFVKPRWQKF